jgi:hypothetical protein
MFASTPRGVKLTPRRSGHGNLKKLVQPSYPLVNIQKAMENGPFIDGLPMKNGDFH